MDRSTYKYMYVCEAYPVIQKYAVHLTARNFTLAFGSNFVLYIYHTMNNYAMFRIRPSDNWLTAHV